MRDLLAGLLLAVCALVLVIVSGRTALVPEKDAIGPHPILPKPNKRLIPTIKESDAKLDGALQARLAALSGRAILPVPFNPVGTNLCHHARALSSAVF
jgi:hypothetical protein